MNPLTPIATKLVLVLILLLSLVGGYYYIKSLKSELKIQKENVSKLETALTNQSKVIESLENDSKTQSRIRNDLLKTVQGQQAVIDDLNDKFKIKANGHSRDLGAISRAKPGLINKIVDTSTTNVNRCFELATGAKLKDGEQNNDCKELINSINH